MTKVGVDNATESALKYLYREVKPIDSVGNGVNCICCTKHVPLPLRFYRVKQHTLCMNAYGNLIVYIEMWQLMDGRPDGKYRKHFGAFIQHLAEELITRYSV